MVLVPHTKRRVARRKEATNSGAIIQLMISISGVMFLFGITWLFAVLTISVPKLRETFQILFTVFNSFQGFFIFLFFCVINKDAWKETIMKSRQSELHTPYAISNGKASFKSHTTQSSRRDPSTLKRNSHSSHTAGEAKNDLWSSENSEYKVDGIPEEDCYFKPKEDPATIDSVTSHADSISISEDDPQEKISTTPFTSATIESDIDQTDSADVEQDHPGRKSFKHNSPLKVSVRRYPSMKECKQDMEMEVEEMEVELHSESSSDSDDEDNDLK